MLATDELKYRTGKLIDQLIHITFIIKVPAAPELRFAEG